MTVEEIDESRETKDETDALKAQFPTYARSRLYRVAFWSQKQSLLGYAIVRADDFGGEPTPSVHVFESVFRKYGHLHNFVPCRASFWVRSGGKIHRICGVMYCQQNARTKACAQVALRSLLATRYSDKPILFSEINAIANQSNPARGLDSEQIRQVLSFYKVNFRDLDYDTSQVPNLPYFKFLYSGLENECGALLGFRLAGIGDDGNPICPGRHIIPFFGHTFNQDTWAPRAQNVYFHVGEETRYISSDEWLSSFIGHDDNFGSNFCVPKRFISSEHVKYMVILLPDGFRADPVQAEVAAAHVLYTIFDLVPEDVSNCFWHTKLRGYVCKQDVVLRTRAVTADRYAKHLGTMVDWDGNQAGTDIGFLKRFLPRNLWMVELSIPEIFSTNYGKLGEILIAGDIDLAVDENTSYDEQLNAYLDNVAFVRLPGIFLVRIKAPNAKHSRFIPLDSPIVGHSPLYGCRKYRKLSSVVPT